MTWSMGTQYGDMEYGDTIWGHGVWRQYGDTIWGHGVWGQYADMEYRIAGNFRGVLIFVIFVTIPRVTKFSTPFVIRVSGFRSHEM